MLKKDVKMLKNFVLLTLFLLIVCGLFAQSANAQTAVSPVGTIEIGPSQTIIVTEKPVCELPCIESGSACSCPIVPTCESPCVKSGETCSCPMPQSSVCKIDCTCDEGIMVCPVEEPICNPPCSLSGSTCSCPTEPTKICPINCVCEGETIACPTSEANPIEAKIASVESGIAKVSIEKSGEGLTIRTGGTVGTTRETLVIENERLTLKTSTGNKEIKISPEEASRVARATSIKEILLKEESAKPVYSVVETKRARILFIIPVSFEVATRVDAQTGQMIGVNKPWWSFLAR